MKPYFFLCILGLLLESQPVFSKYSVDQFIRVKYEKGADPAVSFDQKYMRQLGGTVAAKKANGKLSCDILLNKEWVYPNAQVTPPCYEAETGCFQFKMLQAQEEIFVGENKVAITHMLPISWDNVIVMLYGCSGALIASLTNNGKLPFPGSYGAGGK